MSPREGSVEGTHTRGSLFHEGLGRGQWISRRFSHRRRQAREDICDDVVLVSLVFDLEVVFRETKDPAFNPGNRGQIAPK